MFDATVTVAQFTSPFLVTAVAPKIAALAKFLRALKITKSAATTREIAGVFFLSASAFDVGYFGTGAVATCLEESNRQIENLDLEETDVAFCRVEGIGNPSARVMNESKIIRDFRHCAVQAILAPLISASIIKTSYILLNR